MDHELSLRWLETFWKRKIWCKSCVTSTKIPDETITYLKDKIKKSKKYEE